MGYTSPEVKDRYNKKTYDQILIRVPKGAKDQIKKKAQSMGYESVNKFIMDAVNKY